LDPIGSSAQKVSIFVVGFSVVGRPNNNGVFELTTFFQTTKEFPEKVVHCHEGREISVFSVIEKSGSIVLQIGIVRIHRVNVREEGSRDILSNPILHHRNVVSIIGTIVVYQFMTCSQWIDEYIHGLHIGVNHGGWGIFVIVLPRRECGCVPTSPFELGPNPTF
jgi:hypothetical protein